MKGKLFSVSLLFVTAWFMAMAGKSVREFEVGGSPHLILENISGDIEVTTGASDRIIVKFTKEDDRIEVEMNQSGDRVEVKTIYPQGNFRGKGGVDFQIQFPAEGRLEVQSVSGTIKVKGVNGELGLKSVSGDVEVDNAEGRLDLSSVSGDVVMTQLGVADVDANSISGDVEYSKGHLDGGDYSFSSTSGNVSISHSRDASYRINGRSISGSISNRVGGDIDIHEERYSSIKSVSGNYNGGEVGLQVNTVSGNLTLSFD